MKNIEVSNYISSFPNETQLLLNDLRTLIFRLVPEAAECIKYKMPTYFLKENLFHFAAYKSHIGFYPTPSAITTFESEIQDYKYSKGAVQFPLSEPLPLNLIERMVKFRVEESS